MIGFDIYVAFVNFIFAVILHEFGHFIYLRFHLKKDVEIRFFVREKAHLGVGKEEDYKDLTPKQLRGTYMWGILLGFVPLLFNGFMNYWTMIFWIPYCWGIKGDIKNFMRTFSKKFNSA